MPPQIENNVPQVNNEPQKKCFEGCKDCSSLTNCKCAKCAGIGVVILVVIAVGVILLVKYL